MDIATSEACNMACDYCFVNKTDPRAMDLETLRRGVERFGALPWSQGTVTFTTSEPLLRPARFRAGLDFLYSWMESRGRELRIVATTNGLNLGPGLRDYLEGLDGRFQLNVSLDGTRASHDAHRRLRSAGASFDRAWGNFSALNRKDRVRVILTVAPDQAARLNENMAFIRGAGFSRVDVFPQMLAFWNPRGLEELERELERLVEEANRPGAALELRLLNRLWGPSHYAKVLLGADGRFYLFEWVLTWPYSRRGVFAVGDVRTGLDLRRRAALFGVWMARLEAAGGGRCRSCPRLRLCGFPLPLYLWCLNRGADFPAYLANFCRIAELFARQAARIEPERRNDLDAGKLQQGPKGLITDANRSSASRRARG
ncbi:MAG: radical SAM protein [Elusimicrobia bacterium]|nr:radical SAM protein [Elusimicrobiota bacterium]